MKNFDKELEKLIFKNGIYKYNHRLLRQIEINNCIQKQWDSLEYNNIAIWGGGWHTYQLLQCLTEIQRSKIDVIIDKKPENTNRFKFGIEVVSPEVFFREKKVDTIVISSFKYRKEINLTILNNSSRYNIVDLYNFLENFGIVLNQEFYKGHIVTYEDIFISRSIFNKESSSSKKKCLMRKIIGQYIGIRDFRTALGYIRLGIEREDDDFINYQNFSTAIINLMYEIQQRFCGRDHIIVNWLDALCYKELKYMPFLQELSKTGIFFENAYAVSTYTTATFKAMITGKLFIDDKLYEQKLSNLSEEKLIRILEKEKYQFFYAGLHCTNQSEFTINEIALLYQQYEAELQLPDSCLQWWTLNFLANNEQKCCILIHSLSETHPPYYSGNLKKMKKYNGWLSGSAMDTDEKEVALRQINSSLKNFDKQLAWYHQWYGDRFVTMYMSDHGQYRGEKPVCIDGANHVVLMINGKKVPTYKAYRMFGLNQFPELMELVIEGGLDHLENILKEYVCIQTDDIYNEDHVNLCLETKEDQVFYDLFSQHRGVITMDETYVKYASGAEYYLINNESDNLISSEKYVKRINQLRKLCGYNFIKISEEKRYFGAKKMYEKHNLHFL
ncbi:MAG: sulfatase-like hydrolase/transferase [Lachnospiraceae bacterium]|nr:sulfatase-like hydrolase/transferase [Lachnospiraceae bacterium]